MPTLTDRLDTQIQELQRERARIQDQALDNLSKVDLQLDALRSAKAALTPAIERSYAQLRAMGVFKEF